MVSVIVFTKDRPLQLHAYIESLLFFSALKKSDITIIYKESNGINYNKIMHLYSECQWVREGNFHEDLVSSINKSNEYIIFGCDDVVFNNKINISLAESVLIGDEEVFGYSFRLGSNIKPVPKARQKHKGYITWNWLTAQENHYNYPWELDCTLYRKTDILEIVDALAQKVVSPNYLESLVASAPQNYIKRKHLACSSSRNQAVVITVNRVQDTHVNAIYSSKPTNIYYLNYIYNTLNKKMDVNKISRLKNKAIHVGSDFFILEKSSKTLDKIITKIIRLIDKSGLIQALKGIANVFSSSKAVCAAKQSPGQTYVPPSPLALPTVVGARETINEIIKNKASFCRFGDGEFTIMNGGGIPFQDFDEKLAKGLREVIRSNHQNTLIGLPHFYFNTNHSNPLRDAQSEFIKAWVSKNSTSISEMCDSNKVYYDTASSQLYALYKEYDFESYFSDVRSIWLDRDVVIICGESVFDKIDINIFDCSKTLEYIHAPSHNAFGDYNRLLEQARAISKTTLIIIILGPTATLLAFDLSLDGYQAMDFGHIAKDYDAYKKKVAHTNQSIAAFYKPD